MASASSRASLSLRVKEAPVWAEGSGRLAQAVSRGLRVLPGSRFQEPALAAWQGRSPRIPASPDGHRRGGSWDL